MDKELFFQCLENHDNLNQEVVDMLEDTIEKYPYFIPARVLRLIAEKKFGGHQYKMRLSEVSALIPNRRTLFLNLNQTEESAMVETSEPEKILPDTQSPFTLDEGENVEQADQGSPFWNLETAITSEAHSNLLELSDSKTSDESKEENFFDPMLYTLEIPNEHIDDKDIESLYIKSTIKTKGLREDGQQSKLEPDPNDLIDAFIDANPRIVPKDLPNQQETDRKDISLESIKESDDTISESLALIFVSQGKISNAISIFEKLCLKYPEKKAYFAAQLEKLKNKQD